MLVAVQATLSRWYRESETRQPQNHELCQLSLKQENNRRYLPELIPPEQHETHYRVREVLEDGRSQYILTYVPADGSDR